MTASSRGERSSRWRFSIRAISRAVASSKRSTIAGTVSLPASFEARHRRSPAMISYSSPAGRTRIGCRTPCSRIEAPSSASVSSCQVIRGCEGFGTIFSRGMSRTAVGVRAASRLMIPGCASDSCWKMRSPASLNDFLCRLVVSTDHLLREVHEALCRIAPRFVHGDRHARGRRLADLHRLTDDRVEHLMVAEIPERVEHVASEDRAAVVEGRKKSVDLEVRIEARLDGLDDLEQSSDAFQRVILRLHRDDDPARGDEYVQGEEAERRRAVDEDVVIPLDDVATELVAQRHLPADGVEQLDLGSGELERRGRDVDLLRLRRPDDRPDRDVRVDEDVGDAPLNGVEVDPQTDGQVCLRVEVETEDLMP